MLSLFDPIDEKERLQQKFDNFFGEYSAEVRRKLLTKNVERPQSLYDVYYIRVKDEMLARNVPTVEDGYLESTGASFREQAIKNNIEKLINLEADSEKFRETMLARQTLQKSVDELDKMAWNFRKDLLSKNTGNAVNLEVVSEKFRRDNLAKNKDNIAANSDNLLSSSIYREQMLSKNNETKSDLEKNSSQFRKDDLAKNKASRSDLEKDSARFRTDDLAKNKKSDSNLEVDSAQFRSDDLAKNPSKNTDIEKDSSRFRMDDLAKNAPKNTDLEKDSFRFRTDDLAKNAPKSTDLEKDSVQFRNDDLAKNREGKIDTDLSKGGEIYREESLAKNKSVSTDLDKDSKVYRDDDLGKNNAIKTDLEKDSTTYRVDDLSKNKNIDSNLEVDSVSYRTDDLSQNQKINTDLEVDSEPYRKDDLSQNQKINTDLETDSVAYRADDLSQNQAINTNLETDSVPYRADDLSQNQAINTNLETDSVPYRADNLSQNQAINTNLETDSVPYRDDDLSQNQAINTNLETDSVVYRDDDLSKNEAINSDLEVDSVSYRDDDLAKNLPIDSDLEVDSEPYRDDDLAKNIPIDSDLESDSVSHRNDDLSRNIPIVTDLGSDSIPYRNDDLSQNNPIATDLASDSGVYRNDDLSRNISSDNNISEHVNMYGARSTANSEKDYNLSRNRSIQTDLLTDSAGFRSDNLAMNPPGGLFGVNVSALGTSQFIGVSRVWVQGLLFRNLQLLRNKESKSDLYSDQYWIGGIMMTRNNYYYSREGSNESPFYTSDSQNYSLLRDTLNPSFGTKLPITPGNDMPTKLLMTPYLDQPSPIYRNLQLMIGGAEASVSTGLFYGLSAVKKKIKSENLGSLGGDSKMGEYEYYEATGNIARPEGTLTTLIRQYLTYANPYSVVQPGESRQNASTNVQGQNGVQYAEAITTFQDTPAAGSGLKDLLEHYDVFNNYEKYSQNRLSLLAPGIDYLKGDIEYLYQGEKRKRVEGGKVQNNVFKTVVGNPMENGDTDFVAGKKGVLKIMNDIRNDQRIQFRQNYIGIQGEGAAQGENAKPKTYMVGFDSITGKVRKARQKFTIRNSYAPEGAGRLVFYIRNYSIPIGEGGVMYFPPYIQSMQNSDSANWNSINFLGRPEPIYTYNNSSRDGSITFFILTDFAQTVELGRYGHFSDNESDMMKKMYFTSDGVRFTNYAVPDTLKNERMKLEAQKIAKANEVQSTNKQNEEVNKGSAAVSVSDAATNATRGVNESANSDKTSATDDANVANNLTEYYRQEAELAAKKLQYVDVNYAEGNGKILNVYNNISTFGRDQIQGATSSVLRSTLERLDEMKAGLMFQPAYFSGDLVDFKRRAEFIAKLTRPEKNDSPYGFSFTRPPVCHIRLGDWLDHDVIINSVSYDYADAPWTIGGDKVQPMWLSVTINFNIVGPAGGEGGVPLTSTDIEGFFGTSYIPGMGDGNGNKNEPEAQDGDASDFMRNKEKET